MENNNWRKIDDKRIEFQTEMEMLPKKMRIQEKIVKYIIENDGKNAEKYNNLWKKR